MTFEQKVIELLTGNGMFDEQANEVLAMMKADPANKAMGSRWRNDADGYPEMMLDVLLLSAKDNALRYIDQHCPQAWFARCLSNLFLGKRPIRCSKKEVKLMRLVTLKR